MPIKKDVKNLCLKCELFKAFPELFITLKQMKHSKRNVHQLSEQLIPYRKHFAYAPRSLYEISET